MWGQPESIIKINLDAIQKAKAYCRYPKYCIMNSETLESISNDLSYKNTKEPGGYYEKSKIIFGLNIAICEELKFGQFEVR